MESRMQAVSDVKPDRRGDACVALPANQGTVRRPEPLEKVTVKGLQKIFSGATAPFLTAPPSIVAGR